MAKKIGRAACVRGGTGHARCSCTRPERAAVGRATSGYAARDLNTGAVSEPLCTCDSATSRDDGTATDLDAGLLLLHVLRRFAL